MLPQKWDKPDTISTQVIPRDRHAHGFRVFVINLSIERLAVEIRSLQGQKLGKLKSIFHLAKGSSAMPHKRDPFD